MMKKILLTIWILMMLLLTAACENNHPDTPEPTNAPTAQPTGAADVTPTKILTPTPSKEVRNYYQKYTENGEIPDLAEAYRDSFIVGIGVTRTDILNDLKTEVILQQFDSLTCGNEMKADYVLDREQTILSGKTDCPVLNFNQADSILQFAYDNGLKMRGHTLVWHSQTPRWFFTENYSSDPSAPLVSKEVMLTRMENYIREEMEYINTTYPGVIYAWDVVNEAIQVGDGHEKGYRTESYWYQTIGDEYIKKAFEFARKYAEPEQKLFYNDYSTYEKTKLFKILDLLKELITEGTIDGMGMQSHVGLSSPSADEYEYALLKFADLGLEIQITELDVDTQSYTDEDQAKLAKRYKRLFYMYENLKKDNKANITGVTIWGLTDSESWLNDETPSWPLLFNRVLDYKPAYWGAIQDTSIPLY